MTNSFDELPNIEKTKSKRLLVDDKAKPTTSKASKKRPKMVPITLYVTEQERDKVKTLSGLIKDSVFIRHHLINTHFFDQS